MKVAALLCFSALAFAQQPATTSAPCSPIAPNNSGTITINCPDDSSRQSAIALLKQNQGNAKMTLAKIEECNQGVKDIKEQQAIQFDKQAYRLNEIVDIVEGLKLDPQKLLARYHLGYAIFDLGYEHDPYTVFPIKSQLVMEKYEVDWRGVGIVKPECPVPGIPDASQCTEPNQIALRLPNISLKNGPMFVKDVTVGGTKRVGRFGGSVTNDLEMDSEILSVRDDGIIFLVGFNQFHIF